jgi:hypothetical protein
MTRDIHTMSGELVDARASLAETPSDRYDALLHDAIQRFDRLPVNDVAVDRLVDLAAELGRALNVDALRSGTMLDGAILFAELAEDLESQRRSAA